MARKPKTPITSSLAKADRRDLVTQIAMVVAVLLFAVGLIGYIVWGNRHSPGSGADEGVRIAAPTLVTQDDSDEPKVLFTFYEDFLCPACGHMERDFGPTIEQLVNIGAVATEYHMLALPGMDIDAYDHYSARAANAAYCVAAEDKQAFLRFHTALFSRNLQPEEVAGGVFPDDTQLIERARQSGVVGDVPNCVNSGRYLKMVRGMAETAGIKGTPTMYFNGKEYRRTSPAELVEAVRKVVGDVAGIDRVAAEAPTMEDLKKRAEQEMADRQQAAGAKTGS